MEEIAEGVVKYVARFILHVLIEVVLELLIKGPGYLIAKTISKSTRAELSENEVIIFGVLFWCLVGVVTFLVIKP